MQKLRFPCQKEEENNLLSTINDLFWIAGQGGGDPGNICTKDDDIQESTAEFVAGWSVMVVCFYGVPVDDNFLVQIYGPNGELLGEEQSIVQMMSY